HIAGLHGDDDVVEVEVLEDLDLVQGALDQRVGARLPVLAEHLLRQGSDVRANPDRHAPALRFAGDGAHSIRGPDVAGVEAQLVDPGFQGAQRQTVVEVDVRDQGQPDPGLDPAEGCGGRLVRHGDADDLAPGRLEGLDLRDGGLDIAGVGGGHRLDGDRRPAADLDLPDLHAPPVCRI